MIVFISKKGLMIFFSVMATLLIVAGIVSYVEAVSFRNDINSAIEKNERNIVVMTASEYGEDMNVYGDILYLLGCYCEKTTTDNNTSRVTGSYYIMPVAADNGADTAYITVFVRNQHNIEVFENITNDTYDMLDGKENIEWDEYCFYGKVKPLDREARPYMIDFFRETDLLEAYDEASISRYILPYQLEVYDYETRLSDGIGITIFGTVIAVILVAILAVMHVKKIREIAECYDRIAPMPTYQSLEVNSFSEKSTSSNSDNHSK